jgi:hypothetical protein
VTVAHANIAGLLTTGAVTAASGPTSGSASVANLLAILNFRVGLTATTATSSCSFNTNTGALTGTAAITNGRVTVGGVPTSALAANPFPNTTITMPGIATVILNRQTRAGDGTAASTQTLSIGTSLCNAANLVPVPILPGKSLEITLGGPGVLLLGVWAIARAAAGSRRPLPDPAGTARSGGAPVNGVPRNR